MSRGIYVESVARNVFVESEDLGHVTNLLIYQKAI